MTRDRPTILQIVPRLETGGAELSTVEIAEAVVRAGGRALVLTEPGGRLIARVSAAGGELMPFPAATKNPIGMLVNAARMVRLIRAQSVDLVHARSRAPAWSALLAARRARVPFVTTYHGAYREGNAAKRLYNGVMARGDLVIANSNYTADLIAARYATPRRRISVIHRGVDVHAFDPARIDAGAWRHTPLGPQSGNAPRVVLHMARLTAWKGQGVLIEAAARLKAADKLGGAVVVLAGDAQGRDGYAQELHAQVADAELGSSVRFVGHVEDAAAAFLAAHVTVVASIAPEAFGRAAIEAAAMGCPVIATAIGAPPETVLAPPAVAEGAATGWLVPPSDATSLSERLALALALPAEDRGAMGGRGRAHVVAHFTVEAMQRQTLAVYDRLLASTLEGRFAAASAPACAPAVDARL